jgi:hypothetical protein
MKFEKPFVPLLAERFFERVSHLIKTGLVPPESESAILRILGIWIVTVFRKEDGEIASLFFNNLFDILLTYFDPNDHEKTLNLGLFVYYLSLSASFDTVVLNGFWRRRFHIWILDRICLQWNDLCGLYLNILGIICEAMPQCSADVVDDERMDIIRGLISSGSYEVKLGGASVIAILIENMKECNAVEDYFGRNLDVVNDLIRIAGGVSEKDCSERMLMGVLALIQKWPGNVSEESYGVLEDLSREGESVLFSSVASQVLQRLDERGG